MACLDGVLECSDINAEDMNLGFSGLGLGVPVDVVPAVGVGRGPMSARGWQQVGVRDEREHPPLKHIPADRVISPGVVHPGCVFSLEHMDIELVSQLLFAQHARDEVPPNILHAKRSIIQILLVA